MTAAVQDLVSDYTAAISEGDFDRLAALVHPDATFGGTVASEAHGREAFVQGFRNLRPITVCTEVRNVVIEENRAAVLYDLVTDTDVGSVLCSEFLKIDDGLIVASTLVFDWRRWPEVLTEIKDRIAASQAPL